MKINARDVRFANCIMFDLPLQLKVCYDLKIIILILVAHISMVLCLFFQVSRKYSKREKMMKN